MLAQLAWPGQCGMTAGKHLHEGIFFKARPGIRVLYEARSWRAALAWIASWTYWARPGSTLS